MEMYIKNLGKKAKVAKNQIAQLSTKTKNNILLASANALIKNNINCD